MGFKKIIKKVNPVSVAVKASTYAITKVAKTSSTEPSMPGETQEDKAFDRDFKMLSYKDEMQFKRDQSNQNLMLFQTKIAADREASQTKIAADREANQDRRTDAMLAMNNANNERNLDREANYRISKEKLVIEAANTSTQLELLKSKARMEENSINKSFILASESNRNQLLVGIGTLVLQYKDKGK